MRAVVVSNAGGPSQVRIDDVEPPSADGVVIDVVAAGLNFPDVLLTRGQYQLRPDLPFVPGSEVAGRVAAAPTGSGFAVGDRVAAFSVLGGLAEQVSCNPALVLPLPDEVTDVVGAALPMNYLTCHFALRERARMRPGDWILVHGAAGGIGTAAVQLAAAWGARVIAVTSTPAKAEVASQAGAHHVVFAEDFRDAVMRVTDGRGVDLVVDPVGGDRFTDSLRALAPGGRLLVIGFTAGAIPEVKVNRLLLNNIGVLGVGWGAWWNHPSGPGPDYLRGQWDDLLPLLTSGQIDPVIDSVRPLSEVADALTDIEERRVTGKVILTP